MNVLVCFKAVPELETLTGSDWQPDDRFQIDARFAKTVLNPLDESALEMSLKLRDQAENLGASIHLTALTIGGGKADIFLKTLYALKFNEAVRLMDETDLRFNSERTAAHIADFISSAAGFDLAIMGGRSADGDNGRTPLLAAERLGWPCLTQVVDFKLRDENIEATSLTDDGQLMRIVRPPLVLAIGNAPSTYLRIPTLKDRMSHGKKEIRVLRPDADKNTARAYEIKSLVRELSERDVVIIEDGSAAEKAGRLYDEFLKSRL